jgi:hypothetical protein
MEHYWERLREDELALPGMLFTTIPVFQRYKPKVKVI